MQLMVIGMITFSVQYYTHKVFVALLPFPHFKEDIVRYMIITDIEMIFNQHSCIVLGI